MKQFIVLVFLFIIMSTNVNAKEFKIAVLYWSMKIEGQVAMRKGLEEEVKKINALAKIKHGHTIKVTPHVAGDGEKGIINQLQQFNKIIEKGLFDLIIVQPTDNAALSNSLKLANNKKIPIIVYDQYIIGGRTDSYITSNNYQAGMLDGEYISSLFKNDYQIKLVIVEYPNVSSTVERVDGFIDALKKGNKKFKVLKTYNAVEPISGKKAGEDILRDFPHKGSIDVVFTVNDGGGLAVVEQLLKAKRKEIKVASIDGDPRSVKLISENKMIAIDSAQFCGEIGRKSLSTAYQLLSGNKVASKILIPTFPVTKETILRYPGWLGGIPRSFNKPWNKKQKWDNSVLEFK